MVFSNAATGLDYLDRELRITQESSVCIHKSIGDNLYYILAFRTQC